MVSFPFPPQIVSDKPPPDFITSDLSNPIIKSFRNVPLMVLPLELIAKGTS